MASSRASVELRALRTEPRCYRTRSSKWLPVLPWNGRYQVEMQLEHQREASGKTAETAEVSGAVAGEGGKDKRKTKHTKKKMKFFKGGHACAKNHPHPGCWGSPKKTR